MTQQRMVEGERKAAERYANAMADLGAHFDKMQEEPHLHAILEAKADSAQYVLQQYRRLVAEQA
jgi:hypothetical protein